MAQRWSLSLALLYRSLSLSFFPCLLVDFSVSFYHLIPALSPGGIAWRCGRPSKYAPAYTNENIDSNGIKNPGENQTEADVIGSGCYRV